MVSSEKWVIPPIVTFRIMKPFGTTSSHDWRREYPPKMVLFLDLTGSYHFCWVTGVITLISGVITTQTSNWSPGRHFCFRKKQLARLEEREPPKAPFATFSWCVCRTKDGRFLSGRPGGGEGSRWVSDL